jgi:hypothetical protein
VTTERKEHGAPKPEATPAPVEEVVLLEDLAPRTDPRGGARKLVFGEEDPAARWPGTGRPTGT